MSIGELRTSLPPPRIVHRLSPTAYLRIYPVTAVQTTGRSHRRSTTGTLSSEWNTRELHLDRPTFFLPTHPHRIRHTQEIGGNPSAFPFELTWPSPGPEPELCPEFADGRVAFFSIAYHWGYDRGLTDPINRLCNKPPDSPSRLIFIFDKMFPSTKP